jgi:hypothetical protein
MIPISLLTSLSNAGHHLGDVLWWQLTEARIAQSHLKRIWTDHHLNPDWLPEPATAEKAFRGAVKESQVGQADHLVRLGREDDDHLIFAIVHESRSGNGDVHHKQIAKVALDKHNTAELSCDDPLNELFVAISAAYQRLLTTFTPDDLRRSILKVLDACAAITLRDHGGVYWVPATYAETLRHLKAAVAFLGHSRLDLLPIHNSQEGNQTLSTAVRESMTEDIRSLRAEIDSFLQAPPDRASTLVRRLEAFDALRNKAQLYNSILQVQVMDLEADLNQLTLHVEGLLAAKAA